jgi:hypothetical protein
VSQVEDIDSLRAPKRFSFFGSHCLHTDIPFRELATLDCFVKVFLVRVWGSLGRFFLGQEAGALPRPHMDLAVNPSTGSVDKLECMAAVAMDVAPAVRDSAVSKGVDDLMDRLGVLREVVPEHGRVVCACQVSGGMALLRMD